MQTVCNDTLSAMFKDAPKQPAGETYRPNVMHPDEVRLARQFFFGGLAISGIMLMVIHAFGL